MLKIGLTGSIGMGKTTTANMFGQLGVPIFDADDMVHTLYQKGYQGFDIVNKICSDATKGDQVDREILSTFILKNPHALNAIEDELHPLIQAIEEQFFIDSQKSGADYIIFVIPLLFETNSGDKMDKIIVVTADTAHQKQRVMARDGMSTEKFDMINTKQLPDAEKRQLADYIVDTSDGLEAAKQQVALIHTILSQSSQSA